MPCKLHNIIIVLFIYIARLASNEIFHFSLKIIIIFIIIIILTIFIRINLDYITYFYLFLNIPVDSSVLQMLSIKEFFGAKRMCTDVSETYVLHQTKAGVWTFCSMVAYYRRIVATPNEILIFDTLIF